MVKKIDINVIDDGHFACNSTCASIKEKGLPHQSIWLYLSHLIRNIDNEEDLSPKQRQTVLALFDKYLETVSQQKSAEVAQQQGLYFLEEVSHLRNSRRDKKIKEEQIFIENLLITISRHLEKIYTGLHAQNTTSLIEDFKSKTINAIRDAPDKKSIINLVETSFNQVNAAVETNIALIKDSVESMLNLESKAILDNLTGIFNRRFYDQELPKMVNAFCKREGAKPFSILSIDIDHFKQVNDTYGHFIGDVALQHIARVLQRNCRAGIDSPIRHGGDEFTLFLIGATEEVALKKAEIILAEVAEKPVIFSRQDTQQQTNEISLNLTLSIGVCELDYAWAAIPTTELIHSVINPEHEMPESEKLTLKLIEATDSALYRAKEKGRNKVCSYRTQ